MRRTLSILAAVALVAPASAAIRKRPLEPALTVVTSGSEQALKYGDTVLSRPFGAQLVDGIAVVGRYGTPAERLFLVEGTAGSACPARYLVVAAKKDQQPIVSAPFGTCGMGATAQYSSMGLTISIAPGAGGGLPVRYVYLQGTVRPLDAPAKIADASVGMPTLRCRNPSDMASLDGDAFQSELDRMLPAEYREMKGIRHADLTPTALHDMVAGLACLANGPGNTTRVSVAAAPLFASKRYGEDSFAALDRIAGASNSDPSLRASARAFSANMRYYVGRREPL